MGDMGDEFDETEEPIISSGSKGWIVTTQNMNMRICGPRVGFIPSKDVARVRVPADASFSTF